MESQYRALIEQIGEDPAREGLLDTPKRAAKAMQFLTQGYRQDAEELVNGAIFESQNSEMVIVRDIELYSLCEHHLLPFIGKAHVAYLPDGKVIGLSKIPRIVDMFARRLQIQENLTVQIAECVQELIGAKGVERVVEIKLNAGEKALFNKSVGAVRELIAAVKNLQSAAKAPPKAKVQPKAAKKK